MLQLRLMRGPYAVSQLGPSTSIPDWADGPGFVSISRTADELSIVCLAERVPDGVRSERGWSCLQLVGPFEFALTGVLLAVLRPLAEAGIGIFAVSTFDTDYVMVKAERLAEAFSALEQAGHQVDHHQP
jgi:uncharacterized protein